MKWFKHMTSSALNEKLLAVEDELGMAGSGVYWRLVEIVGAHFDEKMETEVTLPLKVWGNFCKSSPKVFQKFCKTLEEKKLIFVKFSEKSATVSIPNLLKFQDEQSQKKFRNRESVGSQSGASPDLIRIEEEEKREEEETPPTPPSGGSPGEPESCETVPADETAIEPEPPEPDYSLTLPETARLEAHARARAVKLLPILAALYAETLAREGWKPFALLNKRESHTGSLMRNISSDSERSGIEFWRGHVNRIRGSGFHMGRVPDKAGEYFKSRNFEWFLALKNVDNIAGWVIETPAAKSAGQRTYEALKDEVWE